MKIEDFKLANVIPDSRFAATAQTIFRRFDLLSVLFGIFSSWMAIANKCL